MEFRVGDPPHLENRAVITVPRQTEALAEAWTVP